MRRVDLYHAHGSPTRYLYEHHGCRCVACRAARREYRSAYNATHREEIAAYRASHREDANNRERRRKYDLLPGEWDERLAKQDARCAIHGGELPAGQQWHTDHDHETGKVRGILCPRCNKGLGHFQDNPNLLMAAIEYLAAATL